MDEKEVLEKACKGTQLCSNGNDLKWCKNATGERHPFIN